MKEKMGSIKNKILEKLSNKKFELNIFEYTAYLVEDKETAEQILDDIKYDIDISNTQGLNIFDSNKYKDIVFICIFNDKDDVLVHECVHVGLILLDIIGEKIDSDSEILPYLTQTVYRECKKLMNINKQKRTLK